MNIKQLAKNYQEISRTIGFPRNLNRILLGSLDLTASHPLVALAPKAQMMANMQGMQGMQGMAQMMGGKMGLRLRAL